MSKATSLTSETLSLPKSISNNSNSSSSSSSSSSGGGGGGNLTDPIVLHDPGLKPEGIARLYRTQNKFNMEEK